VLGRDARRQGWLRGGDRRRIWTRRLGVVVRYRLTVGEEGDCGDGDGDGDARVRCAAVCVVSWGSVGLC
jgi:hypothetical protein